MGVKSENRARKMIRLRGEMELKEKNSRVVIRCSRESCNNEKMLEVEKNRYMCGICGAEKLRIQ